MKLHNSKSKLIEIRKQTKATLKNACLEQIKQVEYKAGINLFVIRMWALIYIDIRDYFNELG